MITPKALYDARPSLLELRAWWRGRDSLSEILPNLWMGGFPRPGGSIRPALAKLGIEHVLSATFDRPDVPGATLTRVPFLDVALPKDTAPLRAAAREAAALVQAGKRVYVSCGHGHNRSGLLVGLILADLYPQMNGAQIVSFIRARRGHNALHNRRFERFVRDLA